MVGLAKLNISPHQALKLGVCWRKQLIEQYNQNLKPKKKKINKTTVSIE